MTWNLKHFLNKAQTYTTTWKEKLSTLISIYRAKKLKIFLAPLEGHYDQYTTKIYFYHNNQINIFDNW